MHVAGKYYSQLLNGQRYGSWTVTKLIVRDERSRVKVWCKCDCGTEQYLYAYQLVNGKTSQCRKCSSGQTDTKMSLANKAYRRLLGSEKTSSITPAQILSAYEAQGEVCAFTGEVIPTSQACAIRWDDSKTFSVNNTLITSKTISEHMGSMDGNTFLTLTRTISEHKNKPQTTADFFNRRDKE